MDQKVLKMKNTRNDKYSIYLKHELLFNDNGAQKNDQNNIIFQKNPQNNDILNITEIDKNSNKRQFIPSQQLSFSPMSDFKRPLIFDSLPIPSKNKIISNFKSSSLENFIEAFIIRKKPIQKLFII